MSVPAMMTRDGDHSTIEKLRLIDRHDLCPALHLLGDVSRARDRQCRDLLAVVRADVTDPAVAVVEMRLEHLYALPRDHRPAHPSRR
jgi:hypothetical protein